MAYGVFEDDLITTYLFELMTGIRTGILRIEV
jgi:hypothetical protein